MDFLKDFLAKLRKHKGSDSLTEKIVTKHNNALVFGGYDEEMDEYFIRLRSIDYANVFVFVSARGKDLKKVTSELITKLEMEGVEKNAQHLVREFLGSSYD